MKTDFEAMVRRVEEAAAAKHAAIQKPPRKLEAIPVLVEGPTGAMCAATMCPLFAADGSPWTGGYRSPCAGADCGFYTKGSGCDGGRNASFEVERISQSGKPQLQLAPAIGRRGTQYAGRDAREFDCPYAAVCQWQRDAPAGELCAPRKALALGVDPASCAY